MSASKPEYSGSTAKASILIGCIVTLLVVMLDLCATRYLRSYEARYRQAVLEDQQRVAEYRRPLPTGEPLNQNAAVWYRLALARTALQPEDTAETLRAAVKAGVNNASSKLPQLLREHCGELRSARVENALACTHCNWELGYRLDDGAAVGKSADAAACIKSSCVRERF